MLGVALMPTLVRDLLEAAQEAFDHPDDFDVADLIDDLVRLASESPAYAHQARRWASRLRQTIEA